MLLGFYMLFHFLVDAYCGAALLGPVVLRQPENGIALVSLYNFMAFCTQVLTGWLCDVFRCDRVLFFTSVCLLLLGSAMIPYPWVSVCLLGLGNSLFHVSAGREAIRLHAMRGKPSAWALGMFVAPGALGITLGSMFPDNLYPIVMIALTVMTLVFCVVSLMEEMPGRDNAIPMTEDSFAAPVLPAVLIVFCVFCRAAAGSCVPFPWGEHWQMVVGMSVLVVLGKIAGGFMADCWGRARVGLLALLISWGLLTFGASQLWGVLCGQFAANLMMAVTLYWLVVFYPHRPGTMFGIAATVLFPGSLVKYMAGGQMVFNVMYLLAVVSFAISMHLASKKLKRSTVS